MNGSIMVMMKDGHGSGVHIGNGFVVGGPRRGRCKDASKIRFEDGQVADAEVLWSNPDYDIAVLRYKDRGGLGRPLSPCTVPARGDNLTAVVTNGLRVPDHARLRGWRPVQVRPVERGHPARYDDHPRHVRRRRLQCQRRRRRDIGRDRHHAKVGFGGSWIRIGIVVPGKTVCDPSWGALPDVSAWWIMGIVIRVLRAYDKRG